MILSSCNRKRGVDRNNPVDTLNDERPKEGRGNTEQQGAAQGIESLYIEDHLLVEPCGSSSSTSTTSSSTEAPPLGPLSDSTSPESGRIDERFGRAPDEIPASLTRRTLEGRTVHVLDYLLQGCFCLLW